jgi:CRP-like cAMP-binding protein
MVGINAFMGGRELTQTEYVTQLYGQAVVIPAAPLFAEFDSNKQLRDVMLKFTQAYIAQLSQNVACNPRHSIAQRLARWMLECHDRIQSEDFSISHEFMSQMLGVRRSGVTEAAGALRARGIIQYDNRSIRLINLDELKKVSCECYGVIRDEYDRLLDGGPPK